MDVFYGVDPALSVFIRIITEEFSLSIDNMGVSLSNAEYGQITPDNHLWKTLLNDHQERYLRAVITRFEYARSRNNKYPNLGAETIYEVLRIFGINEDMKNIYNRIKN